MDNTKHTNKNFPKGDLQERLVRLPEVLSIFCVSRSTWFAGIKKGTYPKPLKISDRVSAWKLSEIMALIKSLENKEGE